MVLSYYLIKYPYKMVWRWKHWRGTTEGIVLYCGDPLDYELFKPVQKYIKPVKVVAKNKKVQQRLKEMGVDATTLPAYPKAVIMFRQAAYRFPEAQILKFGFRHGAYHFKPFANTKTYNMIDRFFMTGTDEVEKAKAVGITCGVPAGFPKLDPAFDGTYNADYLKDLAQALKLTSDKPVLLFTATWNRSGVAAIDRWYNKLHLFTKDYQVMVTVHPWTDPAISRTIQKTPGVTFINDLNVVPHIMLSDVCISDTSSILAECAALEKPILTFTVPEHRRFQPDIQELIRLISIAQVNTAEELLTALPQCLTTPHPRIENLQKANKQIFDQLDGLAGKRCADEMIRLLPDLKK